MRWFVPVLALLILWPPRAHAVCSVCTCTASATGVAFGLYQPGATDSSTGTVTMSCLATIGSGTVAYAIDLSAGNGSFAARLMKSGSNSLTYNLYTTSADTAVWGDGTSGTSTVSDSYTVSALTTKNYPVYGAIPAAQNVAAGLYADTIMVTVNY